MRTHPVGVRRRLSKWLALPAPTTWSSSTFRDSTMRQAAFFCVRRSLICVFAPGSLRYFTPSYFRGRWVFMFSLKASTMRFARASSE